MRRILGEGPRPSGKHDDGQSAPSTNAASAPRPNLQPVQLMLCGESGESLRKELDYEPDLINSQVLMREPAEEHAQKH